MYLFPIDKRFKHLASKTAYAGDSGTDIAVPMYTPIVSVGDGTIIYAEKGHTKWNTPPDTPYSVKIKLDTPIKRNGKLYPYVFYTHMANVVQFYSGAKIKRGKQIGISGQGRKIPHLHISFAVDSQITNYIDSLDGQNMMWDEWETPKQQRREPMIQTGKLHDWIVVPQDKALHITNTDDGDEIIVKRRMLDEFGNEKWKDEEYIGPGKTWSIVITQFGYIRLKSGANFVSRVE